jgi:hypothetical protein
MILKRENSFVGLTVLTLSLAASPHDPLPCKVISARAGVRYIVNGQRRPFYLLPTPRGDSCSR